MYRDLFDGCDVQFVNNMVICLHYNSIEFGVVIQTPFYDCDEVYLIHSGGVAVCEASCYGEPILIYGKGAVINLYEVMMNKKLEFKYVSVREDTFCI